MSVRHHAIRPIQVAGVVRSDARPVLAALATPIATTPPAAAGVQDVFSAHRSRGTNRPHTLQTPVQLNSLSDPIHHRSDE